jgi:hypothetical protein
VKNVKDPSPALRHSSSDLKREPRKKVASFVQLHWCFREDPILEPDVASSRHDQELPPSVVHPCEFREHGIAFPPCAGTRTVFGGRISMFHHDRPPTADRNTVDAEQPGGVS